MKNQLDDFCTLDAIVKFIDDLNQIPSPTDGEGNLLEYITGLVNGHLSIHSITPKSYLTVPPILVGNPDSKYILVAHCDRVQENSAPLNVWSNNIRNVEGKLDNTVSLAVCLRLVLELKPKNTCLLITTSEESALIPQVVGGNPLQRTGGRGFISYLEDHLPQIKNKYFICVDVRPLDKGDVYILPSNPMNLGEGLVLRLEEHRIVSGNDICIVKADNSLVKLIRDCAARNNVTLVDFYGPRGISEIGRGWEALLNPNHVPQVDYHVAWIQPPMRDYHTIHEKMSGNDIVDLCKVIQCLIESFEAQI